MEDESKLIEERKQKFKKLLTTNYNWLFYVGLIVIILIAIHIRMLPMQINSSTGKPGLWDITTNSWTLGPDLDPFLFLRWAKDIVQHGSLSGNDALRYVPLGFNTKSELILLSYFVAWFHDIASHFGSTSVEYSAVVYPVFMFVLTIIAFFLFVRETFVGKFGVKQASAIALIASFFLTVIPTFLPRTIAGIPEKESTAFLFLFLAFYFFLLSWKSTKLAKQLIFAFLTGVSTALMAAIWGGYNYIMITFALTILITYIFAQINRYKLYSIILWLASSLILMSFFSTRYTFSNLLNSTTTLIPIAVIGIILVHYVIFGTSLKKYVHNTSLSKVPAPIITIIVAILIGIMASLVFLGPTYIYDKVSDLTKPLITPISDRLGVTVAENRQPYFDEWAGSFGPPLSTFISFITFGIVNPQGLSNVPIFFWIFFLGSIYLYWKMAFIFEKKERIIITSGYAFFLFAIIFSRYSANSTFNGTNTTSLLFYGLGLLALIGTLGKYYYSYHLTEKRERFKEIPFELILLFSFFFLAIVSARGAVRLIMMLVPPVSIIAGFFVVVAITDTKVMKDGVSRTITWILIALLVLSTLFSGYYFYQASKDTAQSYIPSGYTQQWQKAMAWVRDNTPITAVFVHWWDYGYWVQTMANRATVVDGGNYYPYWDYLVGRYALTSPDENSTLEFLYTHNVTHFLIDSTDIGKYSAFSSIGSDVNYDRYSWISTFVFDSTKSQETKNSTIMFYTGGTAIDDDIQYTFNGTQIFLPARQAGLAAIVVERNSQGKISSQPYGIFVYQQKQYNLPLRYSFDGNLTDYGAGIAGGPFFMPLINVNNGQVGVVKSGALLYISPRVINTQLAQHYLFKKTDSALTLVHSEDDDVVAQIKAQNLTSSDFVYFNGVRGPIRIWEVHYPAGIKSNPEYLETKYPNPELSVARQ